ncbi:ABC transporter substrate-binding protein [Ectothiorhodospiraceae bacterium WFHF3C12]|nr:ABC transporter substrate-binding protein [Ectothiorhodospiraceae bacterium WFHF3C12]
MKPLHNGMRLLTGVAAAALMSAGTAASAEEPQLGGELNIVTMYRTINPTTWDYQKWTWKANHDGNQMDHLIRGDLDKGPRGTDENSFVAQAYIPREHYEGDLAESWELKEDPLRLVFNIRKGVYWPAKEGVMERRELVAEDIVKNFETMWSSDRKIPTYWDFVKEWKAEGKHTLVAYLNNYNANWGYRIGWGYYDGIMPPEWHALPEEERADWRNATGTGPYKVADIQQSSHETFVANEDYWDTAEIDGKTYELPLNDKVTYRIIKDESSAIAALISGRVDIMEAIRWQFIDQVREQAPELKINKALSTQGTFIALRNDQEPFDDVRVRRAMNLAVNQREIMASLLNGEGALLNYPFSKRWEGLYTPIEQLSPAGQELFEHNPEKAKQLLADAGYPDGFDFEVQVCTCDPYHMDMVAILQAYFQQVGVNMEVNTLEYGAFRSQMRADNQAAGYLMDNGEGNPFSVLRKSFVTGQTWNPAFHSDPEFDKRWKQAMAETDKATQNQMLSDLNRYIIEERVPHVWLPNEVFYSAWWPWVKNYHGELRVGAVRPGPIYSRIWIDQEMKEEMGY